MSQTGSNPWQRTRRGFATIALTAAFGLLAVRALLVLSPPIRESWLLVGINADTSALFLRLSRANTGFFAGTVTTRLALLRNGPTVEHRAMLGPTEPTADGISATDWLRRDGAWQARVNSAAVQLRAQVLSGQVLACPPPVGALSGVLGVGDVGEGNMGMLFDGTAVVTHAVSVGVQEHRALYVLGPGFAAGVDPIADCGAWVRTETSEWTGAAPVVPGGDGEVVLGEWRLQVRTRFEPLAMQAYPHVLGIERVFMRTVGWSEPWQTLQRVTVTIEGPGISAPRSGVLITRR